MMLMMFLPLALATTLGLWGCSVAAVPMPSMLLLFGLRVPHMRNDSAMMLMMFLLLALATTLGLWGCSVAAVPMPSMLLLLAFGCLT